MWSAVVLLALAAPSFQGNLLNLRPDIDNTNVRACVGDDVMSCTVAEVNLSAFDDEVLVLPDGTQLTKKNDIQEPLARSGMADQARSVAYAAEGVEAVFSYRGGNVMGNIDYEFGGDFVLEPCSLFTGCHAWKEEDKEGFEDGEGVEAPVAPGQRSLAADRSADALRQQGIDDDTTIVEYSVKFYYTIDMAEATEDIELYMDQVVAETNQGYIDSKIPIRIKMFCIEALPIRDIEDGSDMLSTFASYKGTDDALRGSADAAALILLDFEYCGIGYVDTWRNGWTITAQTKGCALGYYTMGHELGHNFGCKHDNEHSSSAPYPYAYGAYIGPAYLGGGRGYRTIMAYNKAGHGSKANVYSSPNVQFMGHTTGSELEDNARVIKENRFGMAALGDETGTCDWSFSTEAPTTVAPTTVAPTTVAPTTVAPTTVAPTATTTAGNFTTTSGNFTTTSGNFTTSSPVSTTTFSPTTGSTTQAPGSGPCREKNTAYRGVVIKRKRRRSANACKKWCVKTKGCTNYTWYPKTASKKNQRRKCFLRKSFVSSSVVSGAVSGFPANC